MVEDPNEDPEEDPSERESMEEEDPDEDLEKDSEVSEGQLMGSEDQGEERREFIMNDDQTGGPESLRVEIDSNSAKRRGESVTGMTHWKRADVVGCVAVLVHWTPRTSSSSWQLEGLFVFLVSLRQCS